MFVVLQKGKMSSAGSSSENNVKIIRRENFKSLLLKSFQKYFTLFSVLNKAYQRNILMYFFLLNRRPEI